MADDYFLKIEGIEGESQDARHRGEIVLDTWSFGGAVSGAVHVGVGGGSGKFVPQAFQFTSKVSKASPMLYQACATSKHMSKVTMTGRKAGDNPQDYLKITLSEVLIVSHQQGAVSGPEAVPVDHVSLNYAKIEIEYREQKPDGTFGSPVTAMFDLKKNRPSRKRVR